MLERSKDFRDTRLASMGRHQDGFDVFRFRSRKLSENTGVSMHMNCVG